MAEIVVGAALSHSPLMNLDVPKEEREAVCGYRSAAQTLGKKLHAAEPDVVVIFAQDHFRTVFYDNMPAFLIGVGEVSRWGDWHGPAGPLNTDPSLARHIAQGLFERDFEPAVSYDMKVDHGVAQVLELLDMENMPVIPILVNAAAPPLPTPARCFAFGEALMRAVQSFPDARRVAIIGSGGLSHAPLKVSIDTEQNLDARNFFIHGRPAPGVTEESRVNGILGRIDMLANKIRPDWDRMILGRFASGQARTLASQLDSHAIENGGGSGAQELRSWFAMLGAVQANTVSIVHYAPIRFLVTGMGAILAECSSISAHGGHP
jgi:2,3-dihydroxyphenylpropionate 1,2-dioxygenase